MAKKLSSRELAVKAKKKATLSLAPKVTTKPKSVAPLVGAGPLLPGQVRVGGTVQGAGPLLPNQTRDNSYSGGGNTNRSKAQSVKPKSGISTGALKNAFETGGLTLNKPAWVTKLRARQ